MGAKEDITVETILLGIKFVIFYGMEVFVIALIGAALIVGTYQVVRDSLRRVRHTDRVGEYEPIK